MPGFLDYLSSREDVNARSKKRAVKGMVFLFEEMLKKDVSNAPWHPSQQAPPAGDGAPAKGEADEDKEEKPESGQSSLLTQLLFHTSLPINEALDLRAGDVDPDAGLIYVSDALGTPKRIIEIPDALSDTLRSYIAQVRADRGADYLDAPLFQAHALSGRVDADADSADSPQKEAKQSSQSESSSDDEGPREGASLWSYT